MSADELSLRPEIAELRKLLRMMGSDSEDERDTAAAGVKGTARLVSALVACIRLENELRANDDDGVGRSLDAILGRAMAAMGKEGPDASDA